MDYIFIEKENYFKLYDGRNRLMLVTPLISSIREKLSELLDRDVEFVNSGMSDSKRRFYEGYRIELVKI